MLRRKESRRECDISCQVDAQYIGNVSCTVFNLSFGGAGVKTASNTVFKIGQKIRFSDGPLMGFGGIVRWVGHPKYGIEFDAPSKNHERVIALYETLPEKKQS